MKNTLLVATIFVLTMLVSIPVISAQQGGWSCPWMRGTSQQGQQGWYCPWMGGGMGYGRMPSGQSQQQYAPGQTPGKPLTKDQAKALVENYLKNTNNPNLKLGSFSDKGDVFEAEIVTKDGSLADKILVNKETGWFRSAY